MNVLSAGFVCGDLVLAPVDDLPPIGGNRFVEQAALTIGGCAANAAVGFARLIGPGRGRAALAGRIGADPLGRLLQDALAAAGVDTGPLLETPHAATAINTVLIASTASAAFTSTPARALTWAPTTCPTACCASSTTCTWAPSARCLAWPARPQPRWPGAPTAWG
jgi:sugar/nucleoside kinase (ribokinase family)